MEQIKACWDSASLGKTQTSHPKIFQGLRGVQRRGCIMFSLPLYLHQAHICCSQGLGLISFTMWVPTVHLKLCSPNTSLAGWAWDITHNPACSARSSTPQAYVTVGPMYLASLSITSMFLSMSWDLLEPHRKCFCTWRPSSTLRNLAGTVLSSSSPMACRKEPPWLACRRGAAQIKAELTQNWK